MHPDRSKRTLSTFDAATRPGLDWPNLYRFAVAAGCGHCVPVDEEAVAAADELLSRSLPELLVLGELSAAAAAPRLPDRRRAELQRTAAGVLRLLDRAVIAHGRGRHDALAVEWRETVAITAAATAAFLDRDPEPARGQLPGALEHGARSIARALVALPRDPATVPGHLADAAAELLVVFAATTE